MDHPDQRVALRRDLLLDFLKACVSLARYRPRDRFRQQYHCGQQHDHPEEEKRHVHSWVRNHPAHSRLLLFPMRRRGILTVGRGGFVGRVDGPA